MKQKQFKILLLVFLLSQVAFYSFAPLYALYATDLGLTASKIGFIWSGYSLLTAFLILLIGQLENKKKKGKMISIGYFVYALGSISFLYVNDDFMLMVALAINALAAGITFPAYKTMFARRESKGRESEQWAWLDASNMFAASIGAGLGGLIIGYLGFNGLFITMAAIQLTASVVSFKHFYSAS